MPLLPVLLAAGFFAWRARPTRDRGEPPRAVALTAHPGRELYPSLSPDGNQVAFGWNGPKQDNWDIYVQMIGSGSPLRLTTDPRFDYNPAWSPDGRWIAFLRGGPTFPSELLLIPPLGGPERKVTEIQVRAHPTTPPFLAWGPGSDRLVVVDSPGEGKPDALFVVSIETGEKKQLTDPKAPVFGDSNPAISPDSRSLAFRRNLSNWGSGELCLLPLGKGLTAHGEPRRLTPVTLDGQSPAWMPDGKEILFSARQSLWRLAVHGENPPARLPFVGEDGQWPAISRPQPRGLFRLVYVRRSYDPSIWRLDTPAAGAPVQSPPVVAISSTRGADDPNLSPDGRRVAFNSNRLGSGEVWVSDLDGSNAVQLTSMDATSSGSPRWSPDGQTIVFGSNLEGPQQIYAISASGGKPRRLTSPPSSNQAASFSRDGRWIYFCSNRTGELQIWKMPASGGNAVQVTHNGGFMAFESADGVYVYYTQTPGLRVNDLWRIHTAGGQPIKVLEGVWARHFVMLESGIYYMAAPSGNARLSGDAVLKFFSFATGRSTTVARNLGPLGNGPTASADGRTILYVRADTRSDLMLVDNFR